MSEENQKARQRRNLDTETDDVLHFYQFSKFKFTHFSPILYMIGV